MPYERTGDFYKGAFKNGKRHGTGIMLLAKCGSLYKGEFRDNKFHGPGLLVIPRLNEVLEGNFDQGKVKSGRFKILYCSGEFYEGFI